MVSPSDGVVRNAEEIRGALQNISAQLEKFQLALDAPDHGEDLARVFECTQV